MNTNEFVQKVQMAILAVFSVFVMSSASWAVTYYVDATNGNDSNPGISESTPWKTIAKVNSLNFQPGDFILFKRGEVWREQLTVPSSGSSSNPIVFGAYGILDKPVISGADLVTEWLNSGTNVWKAPCIREPNQVFFDGMRGLKKTAKTNLNTKKEWYWDSNVLYVCSTSDPDTAFTSPGVEAAVRDHGIFFTGKDYITIDGLTVQYANLSGINITGDIDNFILQNSTISYNYWRGFESVATDPDSVNNVIIQDNIFSYNLAGGLTGMAMWDGWTIQRNQVNNNAGLSTESYPFNFTFGIKMWAGDAGSGTSSTITKNKVYDNGDNSFNATHGIGIWIDEADSGNVVKYNLVYNNNSHGIEIELTDAVDVYRNVVYDHANTAYSSGIYIYNSNSSKVYSNTLEGNFWGLGLESKDDGGLTTVSNNLIKNNISSENTTRELSAVVGGENDGINGSGNIYIYNCFGVESINFIEWGIANFYSTYDAWETAYGSGTNSVKADPLMVDPGKGDFTLQRGSPCIDTGTDLGLTQDFIGTSIPQGEGIDVGAFEYKSIAPPKNLRILLP